MGPGIFKRKKGETLYSLRLLPIGGYVKMEGEDEHSDDDRSFGKKSLPARIAVVAAGAIMNFILGFIIFIFLSNMLDVIYQPIIDEVIPGMPAYNAGLMEGDKIISLNNSKVNIQNDVFFYINRNGEKPVDITINRKGQKMQYSVTPTFNEENNQYMLGYISKGVKKTFLNVIKNAFYEVIFLTKAIFISLGELITGNVRVDDLSGPVGVVKEIGSAAKLGIGNLLSLAALISINLGIFNLLPIPALDGSRVVFLLIEGLRGKPIDPEKEGLVHLIGFAALILLMLFVTYNDIAKLFVKG